MFWGIIETCWNEKYQDRPTFNDLAKKMVLAGEAEEKKGGTHEMRDVGKMLRSTPAADASIYGDPNTDATDIPDRVSWPRNLHLTWGSAPVNKRRSTRAAAPAFVHSAPRRAESAPAHMDEKQHQPKLHAHQPPSPKSDPSEMDF